MQSAGSAVAWQVDRKKVPLINQLTVNWVLITISYPLLAVLIYLAVKDDSKSADDADTAAAPPFPASVKDGYKELDKSIAVDKDGSQELGKST